MVNSSTFTALYAPSLRKVTFEAYDALPTEYTSFIRATSTKKQYEEDYKLGGFGAVPEKPEGTNIIYDDPVPGSTVTYRWRPFGKGFRATHESMADELYGIMAKMASSLGKAFRNQTEIIGASILNYAFTAPAAIPLSTNGNYGFDAVSLCSTAHPLLRGGTSRNRPTADVDISVSALQDAMVDFERMVDESGVPIVVIPRKLIYAPESDPIVQEILKSAQKPFTADNEVNILQGQLKPVMSHYMTNTNAWFLEADDSDVDGYFFWREKFTTDAADDFDSGDGKMKGYMRGDVGYGDWRWIWGTSGT